MRSELISCIFNSNRVNWPWIVLKLAHVSTCLLFVPLKFDSNSKCKNTEHNIYNYNIYNYNIYIYNTYKSYL